MEMEEEREAHRYQDINSHGALVTVDTTNGMGPSGHPMEKVEQEEKTGEEKQRKEE